MRISRSSCQATSETGLAQLRLHFLGSFSQAELGRSLRDSWLGWKYSACLQASLTWARYLPSCRISSAVKKSASTSLVLFIFTQHCDLLTILCWRSLNKVLIPISTPLLKYYNNLMIFLVNKILFEPQYLSNMLLSFSSQPYRLLVWQFWRRKLFQIRL